MKERESSRLRSMSAPLCCLVLYWEPAKKYVTACWPGKYLSSRPNNHLQKTGFKCVRSFFVVSLSNSHSSCHKTPLKNRWFRKSRNSLVSFPEIYLKSTLVTTRRRVSTDNRREFLAEFEGMRWTRWKWKFFHCISLTFLRNLPQKYFGDHQEEGLCW